MLLCKIIRVFASCVPSNWLRCQILRLAGVKIGKSTYIARGTRIGAKVVLGKFVRIEKDCTVGDGAKIDDYTKIGKSTVIGMQVVLGKDVRVGSNVHIANAVVGDYSFIEAGVFFTGFKEGKIRIGKNSYIGIYSVLDWSGGIEIGNYVHIAGPSVGIWTHTSVFQALAGDGLTDHHRKEVAGVKIGDYVYIGGNSTVYPGVKIASHSVILPNSAVNRDVPEFIMVGGSPAEHKRKIEIKEGEIKFL